MEKKYRHTFEAAIANLDEIRELLQGLGEDDTVSPLDIDLILQKTRSFYEIMLLVRRHEHTLAQEEDITPKAQQEKPEPVIKTVPKATPVRDEVPEVHSDIPAKNKAATTSARAGEEAEVLSDSIKGPKLLGESIHQPIQYQELSSRLQAKPVTNLTKAIGINERFLYIRELFGNDSKKYEMAIETLNNAANFNDAFNYMIREFSWDMDSDLVQGLLDLVRRKFITGQHE
jgi:hypothetical protein